MRFVGTYGCFVLVRWAVGFGEDMKNASDSYPEHQD